MSENQLFIKFENIKDYKKENFFVSASNLEAFKILNNWPKWIKKFINLYGEKYSGKSHLAKIFELKSTCLNISEKNFTEEILIKFKTKQSLIIEDYQNNISENLLYSLVNMVEQENKYLLITSEKPINEFNYKLNDLVSRLNNFLYIKLGAPDDELIYALIVKNFSDRQITIDKKLIDYIIKRIDRSYESIFIFISKIDQLSLQKGKPINLEVIKKVLS